MNSGRISFVYKRLIFILFLNIFYSEPNPETLGQTPVDRANASGAPGNNKPSRVAVPSPTGNNTNPPHDPRAGAAVASTTEARNARYNGSGSVSGSSQISNASNVKWGPTPPHDNRQTNSRGGHTSSKDKMR